MKKIILTLICFVFIFGSRAEAATDLVITPAAVQVSEGQRFTVDITANPNGAMNYTIKANLSFPADLVTLESWQFGGNWIPLRKEGYDDFDNTQGTMVRTAALAEGFDTARYFGTATFLAKKSGEGAILFDSNSFALDENNQKVNDAGASNGAYIKVGLPEPAIVKPTPVMKPVVSPTPKAPEPTPEIMPIVKVGDLELFVDKVSIEKPNPLIAKVYPTFDVPKPSSAEVRFAVMDKSGKLLINKSEVLTFENDAPQLRNIKVSSLEAGEYVLYIGYSGENITDGSKHVQFSVNDPVTIWNPIQNFIILILGFVSLMLLLISTFRRCQKCKK